MKYLTMIALAIVLLVDITEAKGGGIHVGKTK